MLANPVYKITPGYCMNGFYPGFSVGRGATGAMKNVITALETFRNTNIEAVSVGAPNSIANLDGSGNVVGTDVDSFINDMSGLAQHIVATLPLAPLDGSFSLSDVINGVLDQRYLVFFQKCVAAGLNGDHMTVRLGWEWDGTWTWGLALNDPANAFIDHVTKAKNTPATYKAAFRRVVGIAREAGFTGAFDWNGPSPSAGNAATFSAVYPGNDFGTNRTTGGGCQILGNDFYSSIGNAAFYSTDDPAGGGKFDPVGTPAYPSKYRYGYKKNDYAAVWAGEALGRFNATAQWARDHGLGFGIAECGQIIKHGNRFASNDNPVYWQKLHDAIVANIDVMRYVCPFNQNVSSGGVVTEDDALFVWNGTTGTLPTATWTGETIVATNASGAMSPAGATLGQAPPSMGTFTNGNSNATGTWSLSPSVNHKLSTPVYQQLFVAGSMVAAGSSGSGTTAPPALTYHHRLENFPNASAAFDVAFSASVTTPTWISTPGAPTNVAVTRSSDGTTATVTWAPPTFDGGSPITGYVVIRDGSSSTGGAFMSAPIAATARSFTLTGLLPTSYTVTVAAINAAGSGTAAPATIAGLGGPSNVAGVAVQVLGHDSIRVSWAATANATAYDVTVDSGTLTATGDFYASTYSDRFTATAVPTASTTTTLVDKYADRYANTFGTAQTSGGVVLTPTTTITTSDTTAVVTGLAPSTSYVVRVVARNALGHSPTSGNVPFMTLAIDSGSGGGGASAPPFILPEPSANAFPVGASFRPINFGAKVANNG